MTSGVLTAFGEREGDEFTLRDYRFTIYPKMLGAAPCLLGFGCLPVLLDKLFNHLVALQLPTGSVSPTPTQLC